MKARVSDHVLGCVDRHHSRCLLRVWTPAWARSDQESNDLHVTGPWFPMAPKWLDMCWPSPKVARLTQHWGRAISLPCTNQCKHRRLADRPMMYEEWDIRQPFNTLPTIFIPISNRIHRPLWLNIAAARNAGDHRSTCQDYWIGHFLVQLLHYCKCT